MAVEQSERKPPWNQVRIQAKSMHVNCHIMLQNRMHHRVNPCRIRLEYLSSSPMPCVPVQIMTIYIAFIPARQSILHPLQPTRRIPSIPRSSLWDWMCFSLTPLARKSEVYRFSPRSRTYCVAHRSIPLLSHNLEDNLGTDFIESHIYVPHLPTISPG